MLNHGIIYKSGVNVSDCLVVFPRMILDGAPLIAIHKARYYKRKDGLALGPGPFVTGLEYASDCKATVVGKPEKTFFTQVKIPYFFCIGLIYFYYNYSNFLLVFFLGIG